MNDSVIIAASKLVKRYGDFAAVTGIDLTVERARCVGLLGPNGAGKTSTMRMIMGLSSVSGGELTVFGTPVQEMTRAIKSRIGLVPQEDNLDPDITVRENLEIYGRYFGIAKADIAARVPKLLAFMELDQRAKANVRALSGGMKRRLVIARALIAEPDLIVLDEPTTGLDPQARVMIWQRLLDLKKSGKTLLLTTHYMDEAERLCDHIIVIDHGRILDQGSPVELIGRHVKGHVVEVEKPVPDALANGRFLSEDVGDAVLFYVEAPAELIATLPDTTVFKQRQADLEDVFLHLTGRRLREN